MNREAAKEATEYLTHSSNAIGEAKARATKATAMLRHIKALEMKASGETSLGAQEREAYASERYRAAIDAEFEAVMEFEKLKAKRDDARTIVDAWQTNSANFRFAEKGFGSA